MTTFTKDLREKVAPIWEASFQHQFVKGIADGSLPVKNFRHYVMQDSYYLHHFAKVQALGAIKSDNMDTAQRFVTHASHTFEAELSLHQHFYELLDITEEEIQAFEPAPTAYAYTSHMYRAAEEGTLADLLAAILPCYWLYYEIGQKLQHAKPNHPIYDKWIATYASDWFGELVTEQINRLDELVGELSDHEKDRIEKHFVKSSYYELAFWEMSWSLESWDSLMNREVAQR
ncbi:thiaminase II [Mangrovibacillus cuniculi]|uniref:Aminopyrimidine aminohydrolase n=1 Tax=Mangrovibacillus cuniculi TaxID=2593652 RepID=A0A7S8HEF6_9BACI|nr:thiaminase II [Mangrovibacillus cuniculi]QPC45667.1 thiaminase II [Mangrovibacillus cuniculi]